jgi:hypothetical protein
LLALATHPLRDDASNAKLAKLLTSFHQSIITNATNQPAPLEAFRFLFDLPHLISHDSLRVSTSTTNANVSASSPGLILAQLTNPKEIEHLYITLMSRLNS